MRQQGGGKPAPLESSPVNTHQPKPVNVQALPHGAQTAGQAAHCRQQQTNQAQVDAMQGGSAAPTSSSPTTVPTNANPGCPQAPMNGMPSSPDDANCQSCLANGAHAQGVENASGDGAVGQSAGRRRRRRTRSRRRKTKRARRRRRKRTNKQRSHKKCTHKKCTHKKRTSKRKQ